MIYVIAAILLIVAYVGLNALYKRTNHYKNSILTYSTFEKGIPDHLSFVNLGSTYSQYAFNCYKELGATKAFNMALPCESSEADLVKLKLFASKLDEGCVVAITLAPCNTLYHWGQLNEGLKHYRFMPRTEKKDWKLQDCIKYHLPLFPLEVRRAARILRDTKPLDDIVNLYPSRLYTKEEIEKKAQDMVGTWKRLFQLKDLKTAATNEKNLCEINTNRRYVEQIMDFCKERHFKPIIVIPPFIKQLNDYFSPEFINSTLGSIFELAKGRGVNIYDFRTEPLFQENSGLYADGFFSLNKYGSEKFVKMLLSKMKEDGIVINNNKLR